MNGNINEPLVSIIINCFNGIQYLREAIDSVYAQTYSNWEIIFWDNCSTDKSVDVVKSYDEKIKYYFAEVNTPLGQARNLAMEKISGKYVCFIDCDDIWFPDKLMLQVEMMEFNQDFAICYGSLEEITPDGGYFRFVKTFYQSGYLFKELLLQYDVNILTSMLRMSVLKNGNFKFDSAITASEEYCLFMQISSKYKIGVFTNVLAKYRVHSNSLTSKSLSKLGAERRYTLNKIIADNPNLEEEFKYEFEEAFSRANYYDARWEMYNRRNFKAFKLLIPISFNNIRYFILMLLTLLPKFFWDRVHLNFRNRI